MNRRDFVAATGLGTGALLTGAATHGAAPPARPPSEDGRPLNIVFYIADQHRAASTGCYGDPVISTPNIDRFAQEGVRFTNMFSPYPLCGPARACLATGQYPQVHGARFNGPATRVDGPKLSWTLLENGLRTGLVGIVDLEPRLGKYHGYEEYRYYGLYDPWARRHGVADPREWSTPDPAKRGHAAQLRANDYGVLGYPAEHHISTWTVNEAIDIIESWRERPFYLYVGERLPHPPYYVPRPYDTMYDPGQMPIPSSVPREGTRHGISFDDIERIWAHYYGCVSFVDSQFGRLLDSIDRLNLRDSTIVVYTSDHGNLLGQHHLFSKQYLYDDDTRVPFIIRYPGQPARGMTVSGLVEQVDVMPTLLDLLGIPVPRGVQGRSLVPMIEGDEAGRDAVFAFESNEFFVSRQMVRTKEWKLIHTKPEEESLMFDLVNDPEETENLYGSPEYRDVELSLKTRLLDWHLLTVDSTIPSTFHDDDAKAWIRDYLEPTAALKWSGVGQTPPPPWTAGLRDG